MVGLLAFWIELRPEPVVEHPFAVETITPGEQIGDENTEMRSVPEGVLAPVEQGAIAQTTISAGEPVLPGHLSLANTAIPSGHWVVGADVPTGAKPGASVRLVVLDTGEVHRGVIVSERTDDPFSLGTGSVAVAEPAAASVAAAALGGRLAVLVSTG